LKVPGIKAAATESRQAPLERGRLDTEGPAAADPDSRAWIAELRSTGPAYEEAVARLHALLLRAARFEVGRRARTTPSLRGGDLDDIALQSANDALVAVLAKLDRFRGRSRFTTWAYKFALLEAAVKVRRLAWQGREIPLEPEQWPRFAGAEDSPHTWSERNELLGEIGRAIDEELTPHQREVLVALAVNEVPIDVLAERLGTTRGALYKTLHDARRKLRRKVDPEGHAAQAVGEKGEPDE
jgi:RNA polymerase sigma-70 factor (ECF subfamily)